MDQNQITFSCPACQCQLNVPAHLAGVSGPCPSCGNVIQAPFPQQSAPMPAAPIPSYPQETPQIPPAESYTPVYRSLDEGPSLPQRGDTQTLRPEPRELPGRNPEAAAAQQERNSHYKPERTGIQEMSRTGPSHSQGHHRSGKRGLARLLVALMFLLACAGLVFAVVKFLDKEKDDPLDHQTQTSDSNTTGDMPAKGDEQPGADTDPMDGQTIPLIDPADVNGQENTGRVEPKDEKPAWTFAMAKLKEFLEASTLEERLPMIETKRPEEELAESCLTGPVEKVKKIDLAMQETYDAENATDYYFRVYFETNDPSRRTVMMLVRTRGNQEPKVLVDPFIDLYGGRVAKYLESPQKESLTASVIVYPVATCLNAELPNQDKKITLKLMTSDLDDTIGLAYCSKVSKIGKILDNGEYVLKWAESAPCTIVLNWNTVEDPEHPYVEAIDLNATNWNP